MNRICKCSHLKTEHDKGLCGSCPCTFFTRNDRNMRTDKIGYYLAISMLIILVVTPGFLVWDISNTDERISSQVIVTESGLVTSYGDILFIVTTLVILVDVVIVVLYLEIIKDCRIVIKRKDYSK